MVQPRPLTIALLAAVLALGACGDDEEEEEDAPATTTTGAAAAECESVEAPPPKDTRFDGPEPVIERGEEVSAVVETSCGSFAIALDTEDSFKTANSFAFLAEQGFYDGTIFHRIVPGFVIQGGDPKGDGTGGPGYSVTEPPPADAEYLHGVVAMAKTGTEPPGTSGSQFFVVTAPADAGLPPDYAVLGEVSEGIEVADAIGALESDPTTERPLQPVVIEGITIEAA